MKKSSFSRTIPDHSIQLLNNKFSLTRGNKILPAILLVVSSSVFGGNNDYQLKNLFSPTEGALQAEENGRVMIYDRLSSETVNMAMDQHFGRIENMMFIRTQYIQENGEYEAEDEDCD